MKNFKIIFSICIISLLGFISCESNIDDNYWKNADEILGTWKSSGYSASIIITFHKNGTATGTYYSKSSNFTGAAETFEWNSYIYDPENEDLYYSYYNENNDGYYKDKYVRAWSSCHISGNEMECDIYYYGSSFDRLTRVVE